MDDWRLLQDYAGTGDPGAFEALVERHLGLVFATALRITADPGAAEDVSQSVFILLEEKSDLLKPTGSLASWLYQTTVFKARKHVSAERKRRERETKGAMMAKDDPNSEIDWSELGPLIDSALESLGEEDRAAVVARHLQRMSLRETGRVLGISEAAAGKRVVRAGERLKEWFANRGIRCTGDALGGALGSFAMVAPPPDLAGQIVGSALGVSKVAVAAQAAGEASSHWLASRTAMLAVFTVAAVSPLAMRTADGVGGSFLPNGGGRTETVPPREESPVTAEESEWVALWRKHAPPSGSYGSLMAAIAALGDERKRDVFRAVAFSEWVDKALPIPADLSFGDGVALFELMLDRDPRRAAELAVSLSIEGTVYLDVSSKLVELAGRTPEHLADFIRLVEVPSRLHSDYGIGGWRHAEMALPVQADESRGGHIRDAVARLAERDPKLAAETVGVLDGWHREQALAGLAIGRAGGDPGAALEAFFEAAGGTPVKGYQLEPLLMWWIGIDSRAAIEAWDGLLEGREDFPLDPHGEWRSSHLRADLVAAYAERDFEGCMEFLGLKRVPIKGGDRFYDVVASRLAEDPGGTLGLLREAQRDGELFRLTSLMHSLDESVVPMVWDWCAAHQDDRFAREAADWLLSAKADDDPESAVDLYLNHAGLVDRFPGYEIGHALRFHSPTSANRLLDRLPEKERTEVIYAMLSSQTDLKWDIGDCRELYERLPRERRAGPAETIAARLAETDPKAGVSWVMSRAEGDVRNAAVRGLVGTWAKFDVMAAADWVDGMDSGGLRDAGAAALANGLIDQGDPEAAMAWAADIVESRSRIRMAAVVLSRIAANGSPELAEELLEASALTISEKAELYEELVEKE